jgi:hypothetical protein
MCQREIIVDHLLRFSKESGMQASFSLAGFEKSCRKTGTNVL